MSKKIKGKDKVEKEDRGSLLGKAQDAYYLLKNNAGPYWCLQDVFSGKLGNPEIELCKLPPITSKTLVFGWTHDDIDRLIQIIERWVEATRPRREFIWRLFVEANGRFTKTEEHKSVCVGKSLGRAMATARSSHYSEGKWDEWVETTYHIGGEKLTELEYEWLKSRSDELPKPPEGYVRINNDTNTLLPVPEVPGRNDVLVIIGKTGSHRGVWSYGEWFRGHPSKCKICLVHKGTMRKIKAVILNGVEIESKYINLGKYKDPRKLAEWALENIGISPSSVSLEEFEKYIDAVAQYYRNHGYV